MHSVDTRVENARPSPARQSRSLRSEKVALKGEYRRGERGEYDDSMSSGQDWKHLLQSYFRMGVLVLIGFLVTYTAVTSSDVRRVSQDREPSRPQTELTVKQDSRPTSRAPQIRNAAGQPAGWAGRECFRHSLLPNSHRLSVMCATGEGASADQVAVVLKDGKGRRVTRDHCPLVNEGCGFWKIGNWTNLKNELQPIDVRKLENQFLLAVDEQWSLTEGAQPRCSLQHLDRTAGETDLNGVKFDKRIIPTTGAGSKKGPSPQEDFVLSFPSCRFRYWSWAEVIGLLRSSSVQGTRPIIFSGDSMVRQMFLRLIAFLRRQSTVFEQPLHGNMRYCLYRTGDHLQYQLWKYWSNEALRAKIASSRKRVPLNVHFEPGPEMEDCQHDAFLQLDFVWDPFQSQYNESIRSHGPAVQIHSFMYWAWGPNMGPFDPQGILRYLNFTATYLKQEVLSTAVTDLLERVNLTDRRAVEHWLHHHRFQLLYVLVPLDLTGRPRRADPSSPPSTPQPTARVDVTIPERNQIVRGWAQKTQEELREEFRLQIQKRWSSKGSTAKTPGVTYPSLEWVEPLTRALVQVTAVDFPALIAAAGADNLPRKDGHFMCGFNPKVPDHIESASGDGSGCTDPTNMALVQWMLSLLVADRPVSLLRL
jgi:hypothetical protein